MNSILKMCYNGNRNIICLLQWNVMVLCGLLFVSPIKGQTNPHIWLRTTLSVKDRHEIRYDFEYQNRLIIDTDAPIQDNTYLASSRLWISYSPLKDLKVSFSPFAYFHHTKYIEGNDTITKKHSYEYRNSVAVDYPFIKHHSIKLYDRLAIEGRFFSNQTSTVRYRNRIGMDVTLTPKITLKPFYELLLFSDGIDHIQFDQQRFNLGIKHNLSNHIQMEWGYMLLLKGSQNNANARENNMYANLTYNF